MTQNKADVKRLAELNALFLTLDDKGQDSALTILRSLGFAQSVMCSPHSVEQPLTSHLKTARRKQTNDRRRRTYRRIGRMK